MPAQQCCMGNILRIINCLPVQAGELVVKEPLHLLLNAVRRMLPAQPADAADHAPGLTDAEAADAPDKVACLRCHSGQQTVAGGMLPLACQGSPAVQALATILRCGNFAWPSFDTDLLCRRSGGGCRC